MDIRRDEARRSREYCDSTRRLAYTQIDSFQLTPGHTVSVWWFVNDEEKHCKFRVPTEEIATMIADAVGIGVVAGHSAVEVVSNVSERERPRLWSEAQLCELFARDARGASVSIKQEFGEGKKE